MKRSRRNMGRAWEAQLQVWHRAYAKDGRAFVVKAPPPIRMLSTPTQRGRFQACFVSDGPPDFLGVADGVAVVFDAKECSASRWPLSKLEPHQARDLDRAHKAGAFAFVALRIRSAAWVLPWSRLGPVWFRWAEGRAERGEASIGAGAVDRVGVPMTDTGWIDILAAR